MGLVSGILVMLIMSAILVFVSLLILTVIAYIILKAGWAVEHERAMSIYKKMKKMLILGFICIVIICSTSFIVMSCSSENPVRQKIEYKGYSFVIRGESFYEMAEGLTVSVYKNDKKIVQPLYIGCIANAEDSFQMNVSEPLPNVVILTEKTFPHIIYFMFDLKKSKQVPFYIASPAESNPEYQAILKKLNSKITVKNKKYMNIKTVPGGTGVKIR